MAGETRVLQIAEGVQVGAAPQTFLQVSSFQVFATDAAYILSKGSPAQNGDAYANSTDNKIHHYLGGEWKIIENNKNNFVAVAAPLVSNDMTQGYTAGSRWIYGNEVYTCMSASTGAAVWKVAAIPMIGVTEIPVGVVDGSNLVFTISQLPLTGTIKVFKNGLAVPTADFSFTNPNITFNVAPAIGSVVEAYYLTGGSSSTVQAEVDKIVEYVTLTALEIGNKQITLTYAPLTASEVEVDIVGGVPQGYGSDFTVSGSILTWNGLGLEGQLSIGSKLRIVYES